MLKNVKLLTSILILSASISCHAVSLWTPNSTGLVADAKPRRVGDLVTIVIVEGTSSTQKASTDYSKDLDHSNSAGVGPLLRQFLPEVTAKSSQTGSASGQTTLTNRLDAKVTATITKIQPNGNLEIQAERSIATNGEKQTITLTGVIRPADVGTDNTITSTFIADLAVKCSGKGPIGDRQKEGVISKLVKYLF